MNRSSPARPRPLWPLVPLALACTLAAGGAEPAGQPPKTHTLFMGANLSIVAKDSTLPVSDVKNNSFVVDGPHGRIVVPAQSNEYKIKIDDALKLTTEYVRIDKLAFERCYTAENDPMKRFADAARTSGYMDDATEEADRAARYAGSLAGSTAVNAEAAKGGINEASTQATLAGTQSRLYSAQAAADRARAMSSMDVFSTVSNSNRLTSDYAAEQYDALNVTFSIAAPRPMEKPYIVLIMRFLADKDRPDTASVWVYAEKLPVLDEHPRPITIRRGGFPPGYHIDSYHVHLYDGTTEIATSVSRKQVALTTDDAFQYAVIEYAVRNRDQTKAPAKARGFWPTDLHTRLIPDKLARTLFVKVGKDGKTLGLFEDEACARPVADPELAALKPELRFLPALAKGKAVEGVLPVKLGQPAG
jgi:hypothetical protein